MVDREIASACSMKPQPGEIWQADVGFAAKTRPVVIGSRPGRHECPPPARLAGVYGNAARSTGGGQEAISDQAISLRSAPCGGGLIERRPQIKGLTRVAAGIALAGASGR
jgi:hypothetical protein